MSDDGDSDYDPLFDGGDGGGELGDEQRPQPSSSSSTMHHLVMPKMGGPVPSLSPAPMRSVENVGTTALPASPEIFSERPSCIGTTNSPSPDPTAIPTYSRKRHRAEDDEHEAERPRSRLRTSEPPALASTSRSGSTPSDRPTGKGAIVNLVPRPKNASGRASFSGPLPAGIVSFLSHDADFIAALRSYIYILAHPDALTLAANNRSSSSSSSSATNTRRLRKVPANAADWDVPFPFAKGTAPEGYYETWTLKKIASLLSSMLSGLRRAVLKVELLRAERALADLSIDINLTVDGIAERARTAAPVVLSWIKQQMQEEAKVVLVDLASLPAKIVDILPEYQDRMARVEEPLSPSDITRAVDEGITAVQSKVRADIMNNRTTLSYNPVNATTSTLPVGTIISGAEAGANDVVPFDITSYQFEDLFGPGVGLDLSGESMTWDSVYSSALGTPTADELGLLGSADVGLDSTSGTAMDFFANANFPPLTVEATVTGGAFGDALNAVSHPPSLDVNSVAPLDPSIMFPDLSFHPVLPSATSHAPLPEGLPFTGPTPSQVNAEPSMMDWLFSTTSPPSNLSLNAPFTPASPFPPLTDAAPSLSGTGTPITLDMSAQSSASIAASHPSSLSTLASRPSESSSTAKVSPKQSKGKGKEKAPRTLTRKEIAQRLAGRPTAVPPGSAGPVMEERTLVVADVRARAEAVQSALRLELDKVERELWALDIEREVLSEVQGKLEGR